MILRTSLYPHQQRAVEKLLPSRVGAMFMEMGTGKTRCAIELAHHRRSRIDRVVWFCPVSLKTTIAYEIRKHTGCNAEDIHVFDDRTTPGTLPCVFWCVVGIESMSASNRVALTVAGMIDERTYIIVDESSYIKGHNAKRTIRITELSKPARYRTILTGTPLSQGVVDLYAQMRFLSPSILGYNSFYSFQANHLEYSEKYPGLIVRAHNTDWLAAKIQPYTYQVTKEECLDLPRKLYESRYYYMSEEQRAAYEEAKWEIFLSQPEEEIDSYTIFQLFSALQQVVSGFRNTPKGTVELECDRAAVLSDAVASIPVGEKIIVWCKYLYSVRLVTETLERAYGVGSVAQFHGDLNERDRERELERFRGPARFFVATASCGGHGLTLNEAAYVVFYENTFKYAERAQAEDRNHRIGQNRAVTYVDIVCANSIDERIQGALSSKGSVVDEFKRKVERVKNDKSQIRKLVELL